MLYFLFWSVYSLTLAVVFAAVWTGIENDNDAICPACVVRLVKKVGGAASESVAVSIGIVRQLPGLYWGLFKEGVTDMARSEARRQWRRARRRR